jgi:hypothetical protein
MNDLQFFPTHKSVVRLMIEPLLEVIQVPKWARGRKEPDEWYGRTIFPTARKILEPSAGHGDILDYMVNEWQYNKNDAICCEIDPDNRAVLQSKGYRIVDFDFLQFSEHCFFDLVLMNPPFYDADSHILKAWSILPYGDIVSLCNRETIDNPYSKERQVLAELIKRHGSVEYIGQVFLDAEIKTDVDVAIVRLHKDKPESVFDFDIKLDGDTDTEDSDFVHAGELASINIIESLVAQYNKARDIIVQINQLEKVKQFYTKGVLPDRKEEENQKSLKQSLDELKASFWGYVFTRTKIGETSTSKFRDNFYQYKEQNKHIAFTHDNVMSILSVFWYGRDDFMKQCIVDTFEMATQYHEKNRIHIEGWKTNKSYMVAKKIIMPNTIDLSLGYWRLNYYRTDFLHDLDKCCCYLSSKRYQDVLTIAQAFKAHTESLKLTGNYWDSFNSEFFSCRMYQKGTLHISWRDMKLWAEFNRVAADGKSWVGGGY